MPAGAGGSRDHRVEKCHTDACSWQELPAARGWKRSPWSEPSWPRAARVEDRGVGTKT